MNYNEWLERTKVFEALAIRKFTGCNVKIGTKIYGAADGNGTIMLAKYQVNGRHLDKVFCVDAVENVDFIRVK